MGWTFAWFFYFQAETRREREGRKLDKKKTNENNDVDENMPWYEDDTKRLLEQCWTLSKIKIPRIFAALRRDS